MRNSVIILFCAALLTVAGFARAQDQASVPVQLQAIAVSAIDAKGYRGKTTITPYIEIVSLADLPRFCNRIPKIVDAVLIAFEEKPLHIKTREQDLAVRQGDLQRHIEESIGTGLFVRFHAVNGTRRTGQDTEMIDHEIASRKCQPIAYLPWTKPHHATGGSLKKRIADDIENIRKRHTLKEAEPFLQEGAEDIAAEIEGEEPQRHFPIKAFPGEPSRQKQLPWFAVFIILAVVGGLLIMIGAYIGYHVAKIRRDRRKKDRRQKKQDRRKGVDRRQQDQGPPEGMEERRTGDDRRSLRDRREDLDRRLKARREEG